MKKQYLFAIGLLATYALGAGCSSSDYATPDYAHPASNTVVFNCQAAWGEGNQIVWTEDSQLGLFCSELKSDNQPLGAAAISVGETQGLFYTKQAWGGGEHHFYLYTPYDKSNQTTTILGRLSDTQSQNGTSTSHIQANSLMYADVVASETDVPLAVTLKQVFGYLDLSIASTKWAGWMLKSIAVSNDKEVCLAGDYKFDLTTGQIVFTKSYPSLTLKVNNIVLGADAFHGYAVVNTTSADKGRAGAALTCSVAVLLSKEGAEDKVLEGEITWTQAILPEQATSVVLAIDDYEVSEAVDTSIDLSDPDGDGKITTANCYVASLAGQTYRLSATVMGNGYTTPVTADYAGKGSAEGITPSKLAPQSAQLLWQSDKGLISDVKLRKGYLYFTLNGSATTPLMEGNAVLAVYSDKDATGDILWSWHIWVTAADLEGTAQIYTIHSDYAAFNSALTPTMMDRNLGATATGLWADHENRSHGLKYQWGRKDPFVGSDNSALNSIVPVAVYDKNDVLIPAMAVSPTLSTDVAWSAVSSATLTKDNLAKYPMNFICKNSTNLWLDSCVDDLWGDPYKAEASNDIGHKSIYDPCPPGWRVPHKYAWSGFTAVAEGGNVTKIECHVTDKTNMKAAGGYIVLYDGSSQTPYPANGMIDNSKPHAPLFRVGTYAGCYWTSMPANDAMTASAFYFDYGNINTPKSIRRTYGYGVRCMKEK